MSTPLRSGNAGRQAERAVTRRWWALPEVRWAAAATVVFAAAAVSALAGGPGWLSWALYLACYLAGGWQPALGGVAALRAGSLDVDLLMVVAAVGAAAIGQVFDGALLIVIFATSGALEALATHRTERSVRALLDLAPPRATLLRTAPDGATREVGVDTAALVVDDLVLVRPGARIGADGVVVGGASEVDQASITGEPMPVPKAVGDEVFAGTVNGTGALRVRVSRAAADSVVARIVAQVEAASAAKAPTQLLVERVERWYSVGVVVATPVVFAMPLILGAPLTESLLRAMTFMIVASPCAVVLATMPALLAAVANAGRHGVLVKSAEVMERLAEVDRVAFDKTGTLTEGRPVLAGMLVAPGGPVPDHAGLLALAAGAELHSEHPLGAAVVAAARARRLAVPEPTEFTSRPGRGVRARVRGRLVEVGRPDGPEQAALLAGLVRDGAAGVIVLVDGAPAGALAVTDRVRPTARDAVAALRALRPVLLTGDHADAAAALAARIGLSDVRPGLLPSAKADAVRGLGQRVLVVGDGVNDAPALATAHVGLAVGGTGADLALETADGVLVRDDLTAVPAVLGLAGRARRCVLANLALAGSAIAALVVWDLLGELPLPLGVAGHEGSTILVALNGLRMLRRCAWAP